MWCGLVLVSMLTAQVTTSLVSHTINAATFNVYGIKVGAITGSVEYNIAVRRNARVNTESEYHSYEDLRRAIITKQVRGVLVDAYIANGRSKLFDLPAGRARVSQLFGYELVYGMVMTSRVGKLQLCIRDYMKYHQAHIYSHIRDNLPKIQKPPASMEEEISSGLFDASSQVFKGIVWKMCLALTGCLLVGGGLDAVRRKRGAKRQQGLGDRAVYLQQYKAELKQIVDEFYHRITQNMEEIRARHIAEQERFLRYRKDNPYLDKFPSI
ncbi:uncharacterized protein LOC125568309 [Nematostella vectensis]|uniref:uncharacterized protein LOC125568309 n=1 Tax=Nematostella vectensis TaxID=45351 RepID=UPI0020779659|nr:uncharacterized protein LOC125568309 [Nematostella vectensis]